MDDQGEHGRGVRIGNFSGFYGDKFDSITELLDAGVDYLTGDYLAELTMLILRKNQLAGRPAYAAGFINQLRPVLLRIAEQGVKVVCNAGGLDPVGCAEAIRGLCSELGVPLKVAAISGDNVLDKLPRLIDESSDFLKNLDTGARFEVSSDEVLAANAYLGAWPIVRALERGADIVICPRVTDASLVMGPAAHHFNWSPDDYDQLAGALWAGHVIECGAQVTGGNYSFFHEAPPLGIPPMPVAEIFEDGSSIITKALADTGIVSRTQSPPSCSMKYRARFTTTPMSLVTFAQYSSHKSATTPFGCLERSDTPRPQRQSCRSALKAATETR
jgi:hypothetical protein